MGRRWSVIVLRLRFVLVGCVSAHSSMAFQVLVRSRPGAGHGAFDERPAT